MATVTDSTTTLPGSDTTATPTAPTQTPTNTSTTTTPTDTGTQTTTPTAAQTTTAAPPPPTTTTPLSTSTFTASTEPPTTQIITSVVSVAPTNGNTAPPSTVVVTQISTPPTSLSTSVTRTASSSASSSAGAISNKGSDNGGLSAGGTIAIAVVIPVVLVTLLGISGLFWWRRRKQRKVEEDERRKEMEAYGYNPNNDPTLPAVGGVTEQDDQSGYRGWGTGTAGTAATMSTNRKASTTLSSGAGNPGAYSPGSPHMMDVAPEVVGAGAIAGVGSASAASGRSRNTTMESDTMGNAYAMHNGGKGVQRGPSNASSTYSTGGQSHHSGDAPIPAHGNEQYYTDYYQSGPYDNPYGQNQEAVIKDNPARRNTRIERAPTFPNQGSSGVATNF